MAHYDSYDEVPQRELTDDEIFLRYTYSTQSKIILDRWATTVFGHKRAEVLALMCTLALVGKDRGNLWFRMSNDELLEHLTIKRDALQDAISLFRRLEYIEVSYYGYPRIRVVQILWHNIERDSKKWCIEAYRVGGLNGGSGSSALPSAKRCNPSKRLHTSSKNKKVQAETAETTNQTESTQNPSCGKNPQLHGFFPELDKNTYTPNSFDHDCAEKLLKHLRKHGKAMRKVSLKKWSQSFCKLREDDSTRTEVEEVLKWFCKQDPCGPGIPWAFSARTFRDKWDKIKQARSRAEASAVPDVDITDKALAIESRLKHLKWPKGSSADLAKTIQLTINFLNTFYKALTKVENNRAADHLATKFQYVGAKAEQWMKDVHSKIHGWGDWHGNLVLMAPSMKSKMFLRMCREYVREYTGNDSRWDPLFEQLKDVK